MYLYIFISLHIMGLIILMAARILGRLDIGIAQFLLAALVPLFGPLCMVSVLIHKDNRSVRDKVLDVNQMKIEDEIYRSIHVKPDNDAGGIVPVEESLLINPAVKRRKLLLNVLSLKASDYIPSLRLAGINDDTEVVHYAVTALVELRNDYNDRIHEMEQKLEQDHDNPDSLREFIELEEEYIHSRLPEDGELRENIHRYDKLLMMNADGMTAGQKTVVLQKRAENAMVLREYKRALAFIDQLIKMEPEKETGYLLKIHCLSALKDRRGIDSVIQMIHDNKVFLTEDGRKTLAFWQPDGVYS